MHSSSISMIDATAAVGLAVRGWSDHTGARAVGAHAHAVGAKRSGRRRLSPRARRRTVAAGEAR